MMEEIGRSLPMRFTVDLASGCVTDEDGTVFAVVQGTETSLVTEHAPLSSRAPGVMVRYEQQLTMNFVEVPTLKGS